MAGYVAESAKPGRPFPARILFLLHLLMRLLGGREPSWLWLPVLSGSGVRQPKSHLSFPHESPGASVSYDL